MARRMKMRNIAEFSQLNGGQAIELAASYAENHGEFKFTTPLLQYKDCNFSFAGLKNAVERHVARIEKELGKTPYSQHIKNNLFCWFFKDTRGKKTKTKFFHKSAMLLVKTSNF